MKRKLSVVALFVLLFALSSAAQVARPRPAQGVSPLAVPKGLKYRPGTLLVRFHPGSTAKSVAAAHAAVGAAVVQTFSIVPGLQRVQLPQGLSLGHALSVYRRNKTVLYAEPDYRVSVVGAPVTPNDPQFPNQWDLNNTGQPGRDGTGTPDADIDAPEAWSITTGNSNIAIGIIDTGVDYNHIDLIQNVWSAPFPFTVNGVNCGVGSHGFNAISIPPPLNPCDPNDDFGHGTHVAGTIGAQTNNGMGVAGINWNVTLIPCKFLDSTGSGFDSDAVTCLQFFKDLKDNHGINLVATNNSWGGGGFSQALSDAIDAQRSSGILFFAAAGNGDAFGFGLDNDFSGFFPANYFLPNLIAVAATDRNDQQAVFSNFGKRTVHLGAPGVNTVSTVPTDPMQIFDPSGYAILSGTSMATPHVTGVAGLLKAQDPSRDWRAIKNLILAGGDTKPALADTITGKRLNANGSLTCSNSILTDRLRPVGDIATASFGAPVLLAVLHINCAAPAGDVTVTVNPGGVTVILKDDGVAPDQAAGDGIYTGQFTPSAPGTYTVSISGGETFSLHVLNSYFFQPVTNNYVPITGTNLLFTDDEVAQITPGFPIPFGDDSFNSLFVSANGTISFDSPFSDFSNVPLPAGGTATLVAPFWTDLVESNDPLANPPIPSSTQNVFWAVTGTQPNRELVVEWRDVFLFCPAFNLNTNTCDFFPDESARFQVVFFESKSDILFNYADVTLGGMSSSADYGGISTIGVQVGPGAANQFSFVAPSLDDNTALLWTTTPPNVTNTAPLITSLSPTAVVVGGPGFTLTVNGSNFVPSSVVRWNGSDRPTTFVNSNQLTATISPGDFQFPGSAFVNVFTFGAAPSANASVTVLAPETYTLVAAPNPVNVPQGAFSKVTLTFTATSPFFDTLHLACRTPLPTGVTCSFDQNDFVLPAFPMNVSLTINASAAAALGPNLIHLDVTGSSIAIAPLTQDITVNVTPGLGFVPITPCRVADTRNPVEAFGGPYLSGGSTRQFVIPNTPNGACNIPNTAQAYSLNLTVVPHGPLGFLTAFPCGQPLPLASNLNAIDGRVKAGAAIVPAGTNAAVCVFASNDTDLVIDIDGYFLPNTAPNTLAFFPLTPCRLVDTRLANGPLGGPFMPANSTRDFPILSSTCNVPNTAQAYSLNYTVVPKTTLGFLTTWPTGLPQPLVSTLNATTGTVTANAAIVPAGSSGDINVFVTSDTDVIIDINGYFAPPAAGGLSLYALTPCRVLDTRNPAGTPPFSGTKDVDVVGSGCGAPATAQAFVVNATVVPPASLGFLTLWPQGTTQPLVSTLNAIDGTVTSNMAIVPTANGKISAFPSSPTHLVLDISAFFAP